MTRSESHQVLDKLVNCGAYDEAFGCASTPAQDPEFAGADVQDAFDVFHATLSKTGGAMLTCLYDVFAGDRDSDIVELLKEHTGPLGLIRWAQLEGEAGKQWRDLTRQMGLHKQAVSITESASSHVGWSLSRARSPPPTRLQTTLPRAMKRSRRSGRILGSRRKHCGRSMPMW